MNQEPPPRAVPRASPSPNDRTVKPGTSQAASANAMQLTTRQNTPSVITVIGRVSSTRIGLTTALTNPRTSAVGELIVTPGKIQPATPRASAVVS